MPPSELPIAKLKAELFKTLGHPVRVRALEQLIEGERSVTELAAHIEVELSHLSQQLAVLRRAGIVGTRREGTTVYYSITDHRIDDIFAIARDMLISALESSNSLLEHMKTSSTTQAAR
ncbi:MAG: ArsR/SmtB family transcription factor [Microbacteriaceae bacterium]